MTLRHEELLRLMLAEKMIPQKDLDLLLEESEKRKSNAAKAMVLKYAHWNLDTADADKNYKL